MSPELAKRNATALVFKDNAYSVELLAPFYVVFSVIGVILAVASPWRPIAAVFGVFSCFTLTLAVLQVLVYYVRPLRSSYLGRTSVVLADVLAATILMLWLIVLAFFF